MKILLLGPPNEKISCFLREGDHRVVERESPVDVQFLKEKKIDFAVSYGYRHIIKADVLNHLRDRIINLHISYLPWNRGADPNLWSFLEDTPKGVTIHFVDAGIDTGDLIAQKEVAFDQGEQTLSTTYARLHDEMMLLFKSSWPLISIGGGTPRRRQPHGGTYHRAADKLYFSRLLLKGWDTPVSDVLGQGTFYLRSVRLDDRDKIYDWRNSPEVTKYMYSAHQISKEEHERWFEAAIKDSRRKFWIIVYDKEEVGLVNLTDIDETNKRGCYASYVVRKDLRNRSIGTLAEYYVLKYFFEDLGYNKICAEVFAFNHAGINVHKNLGFHEEGLFRQHRIKNGEYADVVALAMLRCEWDEKKPEIEKKLKAKGIL